MIQTEVSLPDLYETDETAWLDTMADLLRRGEYAELDYSHLEEYLADMARRDRREVESRLILLIVHVLKWMHQPEQRSRSWCVTIIEQRQELGEDVARGVLRKHAESKLPEAYRKAVERAAAETDLPMRTFPGECPFTLDELLNFDPKSTDT